MKKNRLTKAINRVFPPSVREAARARIGAAAGSERPDLSRYRMDPRGYAKDVLGITLWEPIAEAIEGLIHPPYCSSIDSGHGVGKTFGAAVAVNWWYDTRIPSWAITTAPTDRDVKDLLWTEVRLQRSRAKIRLPDDLMPAAAEMGSGPEHVAKGYTARDANSAHGRHRTNMLFVFDEKEGVPPLFWDGMKSMFRPGSGDAALVIGNPITTTSRAYFEHKAVDIEGKPKWRRFRLSCLDHPNIKAGLEGTELPYPGAVTAEQVDNWMSDWCDPVPEGDERPTDILWRGKMYRPGPIGEPRILGLRPSSGTFGVWSEALMALIFDPKRKPPTPADIVPVIGCDVANFGDDYTAIHTRAGSVSKRHQAGNGWDHLVIASKLRDECEWCAKWCRENHDPGRKPVTPKEITINLEDDATGRAVQTVLLAEGYRVRPLNSSNTPMRPDLYPNLRSEVWFLAAKLAATNAMNLSEIDQADRRRIEQQGLAPKWLPDLAGRRVVDRKDKTKKEIGRSPDDMDAVNLCYYPTNQGSTGAEWLNTDGVTHRSWRDRAK